MLGQNEAGLVARWTQSELTDCQPLPKADQKVPENMGVAYHSGCNSSRCTQLLRCPHINQFTVAKESGWEANLGPGRAAYQN